MTFYDVIKDIQKLVGLDLHSIRPGANIRIIEVDEDRSCIILQTSAGVTRSRPLGELKLIWEEMNRIPAVHVDEVLHGSGTSRNQPETILANLPYVEWLKLDNKKHISFVGKDTHPYGTLKQMDAIASSNLEKHSEKQHIDKKPKIVIVSSDLANTISALNKEISGTVTAISQGVYVFDNASFEATILSTSSVQLAPGTYPVLPFSHVTEAKTVYIRENDFFVIDNGNTKMLIEK